MPATTVNTEIPRPWAREDVKYQQKMERACGWFKINRPKSTRTHHWKVLREAGVVRQRQVGLERRNVIREEDLNARFPVLLSLVVDWDAGEE